MKEYMLICKHMYDIFSKKDSLTQSSSPINNKKNINQLWKRHVSPIPLTQTNLPDKNTTNDNNTKDTIQPSQPSLTN